MLTPHPEWNQDDAALTKQFFASDTWFKIMEMMQNARPKMSIDSTERAAMTGHRREAWEECLNSFAQILVIGQGGDYTEPFQQVDTTKFSSKKVNGPL